jgi:hypothetical protein
MITEYSTKKISGTLIREVKNALQSVNSYGSVEIYVQNGVVTQITVRNIKKTSKMNDKKNGSKKLV